MKDADGERMETTRGGPAAPQVDEWPVAPERVTVAVEGWNAGDLESRALFERSLESLRRQTYPIDRCEVLILVDAKDAPEQGAWLVNRLPGAKVVGIDGETYYRAKNAAMRAARGEILAFADSDVAYEPTWLAALLSAFRPGVDLVVGWTRFTPGFLSRTLDLVDWPGTRLQSGFTDWFYGNNLAMRRSLFETVRFREDFGRSGGGSVNVARQELLDRGVRFWFCAEARGHHNLAPFLVKRLRVGAYTVHVRRLAPNAPWAWVVRVPLVGPLLPSVGSLLKVWLRLWRLRALLPAGGLSLPIYVGSAAFVKSVEAVGGAAYAWFPAWFRGRYNWFDVPGIRPPDTAESALAG